MIHERSRKKTPPEDILLFRRSVCFRHDLYQWRFTCVKDCKAYSRYFTHFFDKKLNLKIEIHQHKRPSPEKFRDGILKQPRLINAFE